MKNEITYEGFLKICGEMVEEFYEGKVWTEICNATKNNGVELTGLLLKREGDTLAPNFYIYRQYEDWVKGSVGIEDIVKELCTAYQEELQKNRNILEALQFNWEIFRKRVYMRLVGKEKNTAFLRTVPYEEYLDMAIVYCYAIPVSNETQGVLVLTHEHLEMLGVTQEQLSKTAFENTKADMPPVILRMDEVMTRLGEHYGIVLPKEKQQTFMYVLSNKEGLHGAVSMTFHEELERFSDELGSSFYILPSSVHEVLLVPDRGAVSSEIFSEMVHDINATQVDETEVLSDSVYYFDREIRTVRRVA